MNNIEIIGLGALNIDHIYLTGRTHDDGEVVAEEAGSFPGGSAANTIYGLGRLGVSAGFVGAIGDDAEGKKMLADFRKVGVDTKQISIKRGVKTGSALCFSAGSGKRSLYVIPGANNLLTMGDLDLDYINRAKVLHISSFADDGQFKVLLELVDRLDPSVKVSFAPGSLNAQKKLKTLTPILAKTYVLFLNKAEIQRLTGKDFATGAEICLRYGCQIVVVTLGKGVNHKTTFATSYIRDTKNEYLVESSNKRVAPALDTTGAGDAFATGFLYGLLKGKGLEECGRLGNITAQFSISKIGARQGLPTSTELTQRYRELYNEPL